MKHKRLSQILGISVVVSLLVAAVITIHGLVKNEIAARGGDQLCITTQKPRCYGQATVLSQGAVTALATSPNQTLLASSTGKRIDLWDLKTLHLKRSLTGHQDWISALAIDPDGQLLASSSLDQTIRLWDLKTGALSMTLNPDQIVTALEFSPDGKILAAGSRIPKDNQGATQNSLQLWDLKHRQIQQVIQNEPTNAVAFSPDGQWLAGGTQDTTVWHLPEGTREQALRSQSLNALVFSPDSQTLITGSDGMKGENGMNFWEVKSGTVIRTINSVANDLALTADGNLLASTFGGSVNLWQIKPPGYLGSLRGSEFSAMFVRFGLNGRRIVTGSSDGIRVWQEE